MNAYRAEGQSAGSISFPTLRVAIHTRIYDPMDLRMFHTPALEHLSIEYMSSTTSPLGLFELFNGWVRMPKPKSLYLDCTFLEAVLIAALGSLPWLEELRIAGSSLEETFWKALTPSYNSIQQVSSRLNMYTDKKATHILVPKLKVLLVNYPTGMQYIVPRIDQESQTPQPNFHHRVVDVSMGEDWTLEQASIVAVAREQAGYPFSTLACWSQEQRVQVLIGSLDSIPNRPKWDDDWSITA